MRLAGAEVALPNVAAAVSRGIGLVPEERRSQGLVLHRSVAFNINIADQRPLRRVPWLPLLHMGRARARAVELSQRLGIKTSNVDEPVSALSGGNQQKVLIARWLTRERSVLVLDELSRGVDIGARGEIHAIIRELARSGTGVIAISSDVEELVALCDRVVVMAEGRVTGELDGAELTEEAVVALSYAHARPHQEVSA
jgi:ABC-type sugar transport system ATPase subunit